MIKRFSVLVLLILLCLPPTFSLFKAEFFSTHDGVTHVVRFAQFDHGLRDGEIVPRWAKSIAFGLGSPVLMFNAPLPYFATEIPRVMGASFANSIKIIFGLSLILSGVAFYFWMKETFGKIPALIGGLFYVWAPYRFIDIYVRGAFPESFAFIFPPLILLTGQKLLKDFEKKWFILGVLSIAGLILSHNVMALLFSGVYFLYVVILVLPKKDFKRLFYPALSYVGALLLTAFYWLPAFFEKGETNLDKLNSSASFYTNFVNFQNQIYSRWGWGGLDSDSPMSLQLGIAQQLILFILIIFSLTFLFKKKTEIYQNFKSFLPQLLFFSFLILISIFLMSPYSVLLWERISLLSFFLYPWRFLALTTLCFAFLASFLTFTLKSNKLLIIILVFILFYTNRNYSQLVGVINENDNFYSSYKDTTDIWGEFMSKHTNLELVQECRVKLCNFQRVDLPSDVSYQVNVDKSENFVFGYSSNKDFRANLNIIYYPNWTIYLDKKSHNFEINKYGILSTDLPSGTHTVEAKLEETTLRKVSSYITLGSLVLLSYLIWTKKKLKFLV